MFTIRTKRQIALFVGVLLCGFGCNANKPPAGSTDKAPVTVVDPVNNPEIPQAQRDAIAKDRADDASRAADAKRQKP